MRVASQSSFSVNSNQAWAYGSAGFQDIITVSYAPFTGSTGILYLQYELDGSIAGTGASTPFVQVVARVFAPTLQNWVDDYQASTSGLHVIPMQFHFVYGTPFALYFDIQATTGTVDLLPGGGYTFVALSGTGTGTADFSNTFKLAGLTIEDSAGNLVPASITSESGAVYPLVQAIPEPTPQFLVGAALVILLVVMTSYSTMKKRKLVAATPSHASAER